MEVLTCSLTAALAASSRPTGANEPNPEITMLDEFERKIARELDCAIPEEKQRGVLADASWTSRIKERICDLGHRNGFVVRSEGCREADTGEWLFDLVWVDKQEDNDRFTGMPLAMQLAWGRHLTEIVNAFEKLLVAKAGHKVILFQRSSPNEVHNVMTVLLDRIKSFQPLAPDERYLLAGYSYEQQVFVYEPVQMSIYSHLIEMTRIFTPPWLRIQR
jgi:hypothetical protein